MAKIAIGVLLVACFAWVLDRWSLGVATDAYLFSYGFWVQAGVVALTTLAVIALTSRVWLACWMTSALLAALYVANYFKLHYLASPITIEDYFLVKDLDADGLSLFLHYLNVGWLLVCALLFAGVGGVLFWREGRLITGRRLPRAVMFLLSFAMLAACASGSTGERIFDADRLRVLPFNPVVSQLRAGLVSHLMYSARYMARAFDEPVDPEAVRRLVASVRFNADRKPADEKQGLPPDVVVIQSESFFNPDSIREVGDTSDLLPNLHRAITQGEGGAMIVPTFGGGTIRTEFEVLTAVPLRAYAKVQFPYLQFGQDKVPSIARVFSGAGYESIAIHGNSGTFWSRNHALRVLGFDRFLTEKDFGKDAQRDGAFLSDRSMTDKIINELDKPGRPRFIFAISIEAHGPYTQVPVSDESSRELMAHSSPFSADAADEYSHYAYHIAHADHEFGRLWDYLKRRGRPYLLVFYGDHLPGFRYVYQSATFRNGLSAQDQQVPWVAVGSDVQQSTQKSIYSWMLPGHVLDLAGLKQQSYMGLAELIGRNLLDDSADEEAQRAGLYSAARLDLQGKFDSSDEWSGIQ
ncbi:LTA synthase family protein [Dyella amyloliquefaciens]|uniref:LTA synthase family protein n=1 Tax=Dyella amyloliquefaciens TaxID=1770545 RepID=UPI00102E72B2|nr:LTA synthase family protein [Dyella amyloliquefaciens]